MSTQILNLTPHEINIGTASIKPFGVVARVYVESISDGEFTTASGTTIPISHSYYGDVENLPNPMPNTIYIVSALVASRVPTRSDVFYPCCMVRDTQGRVIGCKTLCCAAAPVLAAVHYTGWIVPIAMLVGYGCILRSLYRLSGALDEAGYAIAPGPVRVTDRCLVLVIAAVLGIGCTLGYLFGSSYRMDWQPADTSKQTQTEAIRQQLLDLGFPEAVLNDLTPEDIAACDGALRVVVETEDYPVNDGRNVLWETYNEKHERYYVQDTVYDVRELRLTSVGVQLPGAQETWRVYHHFLWTTDPGFCGTEVLQIWPADENMQDGWRFAGDVTGRVLYDRDGQTFTASYHTLGRQTYTADSVFFGQRTNSDLFAPFSMPRHAEHARGYVAYTAAAVQSGYLLNSWCNYTHQQSLLQYPAVTAMEKRMTSAFGNTGAFYTVQHALQFFPEDAQTLR